MMGDTVLMVLERVDDAGRALGGIAREPIVADLPVDGAARALGHSPR